MVIRSEENENIVDMTSVENWIKFSRTTVSPVFLTGITEKH